MTECYFSKPEDVESRKQTQDIKFTDVFPQQNPYYSEIDERFPANVQSHVQQLRSQAHIRHMAEMMNQHLQQTSLNDRDAMTDDQRRVQKIKERMMRKKINK